MIETIDVLKLVGSAIAAVLLAIFGNSLVKRRVSKDGVFVASDKAERDMLSRAMNEADKQRERADIAFRQRDESVSQAYHERNEALSQTGGFVATIAAMELRIKDNSERIDALERERSENLSIIAGLRDKIHHLEEENRSQRLQIQELTRKQNGNGR